MKKLLLLLFLSLTTLSSMAYNAEIDGIYYNLNNSAKTAEVTYKTYSYNSYLGNSITIPESVTYNDNTYIVTSIGFAAFKDCIGLTSVNIPERVTSIGILAFDGCSGLTSVNIPNSVTEIGEAAFQNCSSLTSVNIPNSVTKIDDNVFYYCIGLTSVNIPNSVTEICNQAFSGCSGLTSVTIPNSVTEIGNWAFRNCTNLQSIYCLGETPAKLGENCFGYYATIYEQAVLYVPYGSIDAYKNATDGWGRFNDIREFEPTKVEGTLDSGDSNIEKIYDLSGRGQQRMQRGINIMRMSNGRVRKVMVK